VIGHRDAVRVSQDACAGKKAKFLAEVKDQFISEKKRVVIFDRTNMAVADRKDCIDLARCVSCVIGADITVELVHFDVSMNTLQRRLAGRVTHEGNFPRDAARAVPALAKLCSRYEPATLAEGFAAVHCVFCLPVGFAG